LNALKIGIEGGKVIFDNGAATVKHNNKSIYMLWTISTLTDALITSISPWFNGVCIFLQSKSYALYRELLNTI
jgi:hypothetical protein